MTRAEAAAEFGRKKARQRRSRRHRRVMIAAALVFTAYAGIGGWWLVHTGRVAGGVAAAEMQFWHMTAGMGFRLEQINLTGRKHADVAAVKNAIGIGRGEPILSISLAKMKARLEKIPEIKSVAILRTLPGTITIAVTERAPAAWWQAQGKVRLIDRDGVVLNRETYQGRSTLPVVVGGDAPKHIGELMALLETVPSLKTDVAAAIRVGDRRWNIEMGRDIVVMLPGENPQAAWKRFANLVENKALLSKAIKSVDMRMEDRVFIMPAEQKNPIVLTGGRSHEI